MQYIPCARRSSEMFAHFSFLFSVSLARALLFSLFIINNYRHWTLIGTSSAYGIFFSLLSRCISGSGTCAMHVCAAHTSDTRINDARSTSGNRYGHRMSNFSIVVTREYIQAKCIDGQFRVATLSFHGWWAPIHRMSCRDMSCVCHWIPLH